MAGRIFINYRRGDDPGFTQALYQRLEHHFSRDRLFYDLGGHIQPGDDFVEVLSEQVRRSDVVLVIIGPRWSALLDARRGDPEDFVLIEIGAALEQGKRIIPVLVGGARMPAAASLPEPIQALSRRHAVELRAASFASDCDGLSRTLDGLLGKVDAPKPVPPHASIGWEGPSSSFPHQFTLPAADLRFLLEKCSFAMSSDEARFYLNGIYLHPTTTPSGEAVLNAVATDGHRLVKATIASVPLLGSMPGIILPRQSIPELLGQLATAEGRIRVRVSPAIVLIDGAGVMCRAEPIDGMFPDYARVFPNRATATAIMARHALTQAVSGLERGGDDIRAIKLTVSKSSLVVAATTTQATFRVPLSDQTGNVGLSIGLNPRYVLDILENAVGDEVEVAFNDADSPVTFREPGSEALVFVLMPMKL